MKKLMFGLLAIVFVCTGCSLLSMEDFDSIKANLFDEMNNSIGMNEPETEVQESLDSPIQDQHIDEQTEQTPIPQPTDVDSLPPSEDFDEKNIDEEDLGDKPEK